MQFMNIALVVSLFLLLSLSASTPVEVKETEFCQKFSCSSLGPSADYSFPRNPPKTLDQSILPKLYSTGDHHFSGLFKCGPSIFPLDCLQEKYPNNLVKMENVLVQSGGVIRSIQKNEVYLDDNILNLRTWVLTPPEASESPLVLKKALMIEGRFTQNYYHFLTETFPRLLMTREVLDLTKIPIIVSNNEFIRSFLGLLGISPSQIVTPTYQKDILVEELYYPSTVPMDLPSKDRLDSIRIFMEEKFPVWDEERKQDLIIYTSRDGYARSALKAEEEELLSLLESTFSGYSQEIFTGKESVEETVRLFRRAKVIVGVHGAGLTNMVFSQPNTIVVEVIQTANPLFLFWHISQALHHDYWLIPAAGQSSWKDNKFHLPIPEILNVLTKALGYSVPDVHCNAGYISTLHGCKKCPMGFVSRPGSTFCRICPENTYADRQQSRCLRCPLYTRTMVTSKDFFTPREIISPISALGSSTRSHCLTNRDIILMVEERRRNTRQDDYYSCYYYYYQ